MNKLVKIFIFGLAVYFIVNTFENWLIQIGVGVGVYVILSLVAGDIVESAIRSFDDN